ncbi:DUF1178 family protein [Chelatococcus sambhunathii]|uniref:DUF1178 family protein n=1 Tax=Chelatococcus sambhunathii TaxID=363953 RepID=A0ABU1DGP9_9HYPH|nr:DUF1178 family protein [Chelatococcus sambhunathii]MDR4307308.1 DUF1178 family protein [Chelatococcus sambhunathii]
MIRYGLACEAGHVFDGWFRSSSDFDDQSARLLLTCPACGSSKIEKTLMAPALSQRGQEPASAQQPGADANVALVDDGRSKIRGMLRELRAELTKNSEDVGERFPEVARRMHAREIEQKTVHGRASAEEAKALIEEGVAVQPLPTFPDDLN